ncbi:AIM24 family protein [Bacillus massiliigorillae]|uniref:AIM24 family protein n=1 Tax=Bacillus massiliigorillae TaxID=1243664 RepID=UPI0003A65C02|nr:AIM24 family protein [Bacillus massiliigorillae]
MTAMNSDFYNNMLVLDSREKDIFKAEILAYKDLKGSSDIQLAGDLFLAKESGMALKQIKITLNNSSFVVEAGALHFMKGHIQAESNIGGVGGFIKKKIKSYLTEEEAFKPKYSGTGELFLEPSFGHFMFVELHDESIVVDKGLFYACESSLHVSVEMQKNLSSGLLGNEGWFQTKVTGTGLCILQIPVPKDEVIKYQLGNEKLQVDGNFALLRKGNISFSVEKSSKKWTGTFVSGEGFLQTFEGTGEVWLAPTQSVYNDLKNIGSIARLQESKKISNDTK